MKLTIYVHDLFYEIGHSNVTLNSLEYIDDIERSDIKFVVYSADSKDKLFKKNIPVEVHHVPFSKLKPVLIKSLWFQLYSFFYSLFRDQGRVKISLGVANLNCDVSIIHFIHEQWSQKYFKLLKPKGIKLIYKKIFFSYLNICEYILFYFKRPKVISVSNFMGNFISNKYNYQEKDLKVIHSGFDLNRFFKSKKTRKQIIDILKNKYPQMQKYNKEKPTILFIGAFERKGLHTLLDLWQNNKPHVNFILIGESENSTTMKIDKKIIHIPYTKEINDFYEVSDHLIFPTHYEPFGMVIIEALIKGLDVSTTIENVGASEIISDLDGVNLYNNVKDFKLEKDFRIISQEERSQRIEDRKKAFEQYNWRNISKHYKDILSTWNI